MYSQQYFKRVPDFSKNLAQDLCSTVKWHRTDVFYLRQCFLLLPANNIPKLMNQKIQLQLLKIIGFPPFSQKLNNSSTYKRTYMGPSVFSRISSTIFYITYIKNILFESAIILYLKYICTTHSIQQINMKPKFMSFRRLVTTVHFSCSVRPVRHLQPIQDSKKD